MGEVRREFSWVTTRPTSEQCTARSVLEDGREVTFATWHPQWGGYVGACTVTFSPGKRDGCFDVVNWHDGEFGTEDPAEATRRHYCTPTQLVDFGLTVLEEMVKRGATLDPDWYARARARFDWLADGGNDE